MRFTLLKMAIHWNSASVNVNVFYINFNYILNSASCPLQNLTNSNGEDANTWFGVPAAAQISSNSASRGSMKACIGLTCPMGETPPIANPV